jgi:D-alanine-D-alanine ligase
LIEINPLAGLAPGHSDLPIMAELSGTSYRDLIGAIIESAAKRTHTHCAQDAAA